MVRASIFTVKSVVTPSLRLFSDSVRSTGTIDISLTRSFDRWRISATTVPHKHLFNLVKRLQFG